MICICDVDTFAYLYLQIGDIVNSTEMYPPI